MPATHAPDLNALLGRLQSVRALTESLCAPLETEDYVIQAMPDASPAKWHLAHTTWFFETFVLLPLCEGYRPLDGRYTMLFNSYYETVGEAFPRPLRGLLSRPTVADVYAYRAYVDQAMVALAPRAADVPEVLRRLELGLNHEQQHQELLLTDLKALFALNPLKPAWRVTEASAAPAAARKTGWLAIPDGIVDIGHGGTGFAYDNETPRHRALLHGGLLADRLVSNGEWLAFMADGGYRRHELWLSNGWQAVQERRWTAPAYWEAREGGWWHYTLGGMRPVDAAAPVCHVSYYEADAYARWAEARLPTEAEWEAVAGAQPCTGNLLVGQGQVAPLAAIAGETQLFGDVWEWTQSPYSPYPGFRPLPGALGEYNGKFMVNQQVLRGGSCATPADHIRATYRNFFYGPDRWQFTGLRLARDS